MGPKIDSPRPQLLRAPERKEVSTASSPALQTKVHGDTPKQPMDGFVPPSPTQGGKTPTGGIVPQGATLPASLSIDPDRLSGFKKVSTNMVGFAVADGLKDRDAKKAFEAGFILAGATKQEAKYLTKTLAMPEYQTAKAAGGGGLTVEKYGYRLAESTRAFVDKEVMDKLPVLKDLNLGQIQALALETARKAPDVQPDQIEVARDYFLFSAGKLLAAQGFDFSKLAKAPNPLDSTQVDTGEWRKQLQFLG